MLHNMQYAYPPDAGKGGTKSCVRMCAGTNPLWKFLQCACSGVPMVAEHNTCVIATVTDCPTCVG